MHIEEIKNSLFDLGDIENIKLSRQKVVYNGKEVLMYVFPNIPKNLKGEVDKLIDEKKDFEEEERIFKDDPKKGGYTEIMEDKPKYE